MTMFSHVYCFYYTSQFLLQGDLLDSSDVRANDIVPGALLNLNVWNMWQSLVEAAGTGDIDQVTL